MKKVSNISAVASEAEGIHERRTRMLGMALYWDFIERAAAGQVQLCPEQVQRSWEAMGYDERLHWARKAHRLLSLADGYSLVLK